MRTATPVRGADACCRDAPPQRARATLVQTFVSAKKGKSTESDRARADHGNIAQREIKNVSDKCGRFAVKVESRGQPLPAVRVRSKM